VTAAPAQDRFWFIIWRKNNPFDITYAYREPRFALELVSILFAYPYLRRLPGIGVTGLREEKSKSTKKDLLRLCYESGVFFLSDADQSCQSNSRTACIGCISIQLGA
jgi:hypothetical protein